MAVFCHWNWELGYQLLNSLVLVARLAVQREEYFATRTGWGLEWSLHKCSLALWDGMERYLRNFSKSPRLSPQSTYGIIREIVLALSPGFSGWLWRVCIDNSCSPFRQSPLPFSYKKYVLLAHLCSPYLHHGWQLCYMARACGRECFLPYVQE